MRLSWNSAGEAKCRVAGAVPRNFLDIFRFRFHSFEVCSIHSSKMIGNPPALSNFNLTYGSTLRHQSLKESVKEIKTWCVPTLQDEIYHRVNTTYSQHLQDWSPGCPHNRPMIAAFEVCSIDSSKMIGNPPAVSNFNSQASSSCAHLTRPLLCPWQSDYFKSTGCHRHQAANATDQWSGQTSS